MRHIASIDAESIAASSYQNATPTLMGEESECSDLLSSDESNGPHRRRNLNEQDRPYTKHLSFEGFFPEEYKLHGSPFLRSRKRTILVSALLLLIAGIAFNIHHYKKRQRESNVPAISSETVDKKEKICSTDGIMQLEESATVEHEQGAVASDTPICSELGTSILRDQGGNAVDAAVATALCLGVANPASSGIGGGAMILVHADIQHHQNKVGNASNVPPPFHDQRVATLGSGHRLLEGNSKVTEFIDCREEAPAGATRDMFAPAATSSTDGGLAIGVPGELRGLELLHQRHGSLPWPKVVEPAMKLARDGYKVGAYLAHEFKINEKKLMAFEDLGRMLTRNNDGKTLLNEGDTLRLPHLAGTLKAVMEKGVDVLYEGELATIISRDIERAGGIITTEDLANYRPYLRSPLVARDVHGFNVVGVGPPSSGGAAIIGAARFLAGYSNPFAYLSDKLSKHRLVEASKHVFAIRMSLSDPAFNTSITMDAVSDLVEGTYMEELRRATSDHEELRMSQYGGKKWSQLTDSDGKNDKEAVDANEGDRVRRLKIEPEDSFESDDEEDRRNHRQVRRFGYLHDHGTTHLSVIDKDRNAVAITSTVNTYFGSKVVSPSTGIIFNNQMDDFATPGKPNHFGLHPSEANYISPFKRPLSSMSPTMIFQRDGTDTLGRVLLVLGASGGPKIISATLQVFLNFCVLGMTLYESVASPRVHDQLLYHGKAVTTFEREHILQGPTIVTPNATVDALKSRGHTLLPVTYMGTVQAVAVDAESNTLTAVSDIRKSGAPAGY